MHFFWGECHASFFFVPRSISGLWVLYHCFLYQIFTVKYFTFENILLKKKVLEFITQDNSNGSFLVTILSFSTFSVVLLVHSSIVMKHQKGYTYMIDFTNMLFQSVKQKIWGLMGRIFCLFVVFGLIVCLVFFFWKDMGRVTSIVMLLCWYVVCNRKKFNIMI